MDVRRLGLAVAAGLLAVPAAAGAVVQPVATGVRIGDHPAFVRVVVDFAGGAVKANEVAAYGITRTDTAVIVFHGKVAPGAAKRAAYGVTARLVQSRAQLTVRLAFTPGRMKYASYAVVTGNRLAIDLWKSAPPAKAAEIRTAPDGCLALSSWHVRSGSVSLTGTEHDIFEHQFQIVVRGAGGGVLGRRIGFHGAGGWSARIAYHVAQRQAGTLEAVAFSARDGALECIAQVRVTLPAG